MSIAAPSGLPIEVPDDAVDVVVSGPRPFITSVQYVTPDGRLVRWEARARRKAQAPGVARGLTWWIGLLFAIGATCFVLGPAAPSSEPSASWSARS
ncbi:MAG: hypothetical protein WAL91_08720 [Propionicimonas sp.]